MAEKLTGRVTNGSEPGCQLTAAVLHGGLGNVNDRERQEEQKAEARIGEGQGCFEDSTKIKATK